MIYASIVLFAIAASVGIALALSYLQGKAVTLSRALVHGAFAATGLVVLLAYLILGPHPGMALASFIVFLVAALGGFVLFALHVQKRKLPMPVIAVHALVAVTGFVILLLATFAA
jgi:hypothetical protein